ncbi:MAG TPA: glycosyl hydrolase 53 family protein [Armatimonadota bacterium]|nr:glycosyl hydrolase 53 family protein [Armatimonadota bacterium]
MSISSFHARCSIGCLLGLFVTGFPVGHAASARSPDPRHFFLRGADVSELPFHETRGIQYFDGGKAEDLLTIARKNHWNVIRVRLWVNPAPQPESRVSSLGSVTLLGKRVRAMGLKFLLDIHYSDTWADPAHQKKPAAWDTLPFPQLVHQVRDYTRDVISHLRENGAMPDLVQIGNETKSGFLYGSGLDGAGPEPGGGFWETTPGGWDRFVRLFAAGLAGVRDGSLPAAPPLTILHLPDGQDTGFVKWYFATLQSHEHAMGVNLDYNMIGLSYYPGRLWDPKTGYPAFRLSHLVDTMDYIARTLHKPFMIVETNWPHGGSPNGTTGTPEFSFTPEGQVEYYQALIRAVKSAPGGLGKGVIAWEIDSLNWDSVFDSKGNSLPAVQALGEDDETRQ